jgi:hypothetical protein
MIARLAILIGVGVVVLSTNASARGWDEKLDGRAWACSGPYSPFPLNVLNGKDRAAAICAGVLSLDRRDAELLAASVIGFGARHT